MLRIARHRGWTQVRVEGDPAFRREAWVQAQAMDISVRGYRPTERDRQAGGARTPARGPDRPRPTERPVAPSPPLEARMRLAAAAVHALVGDPAARTRLLERAWARAAPTSSAATPSGRRQTSNGRRQGTARTRTGAANVDARAAQARPQISINGFLLAIPPPSTHIWGFIYSFLIES
ncbi:LPD7 domain-containing protein [Brevundimonas sp. UBA2416]|uniref:LPD7 domain-containing protein n=1 Tax=Brevundimonas sp. UBA2416 TaxID=1946124 RepID=UPI00344C10DC